MASIFKSMKTALNDGIYKWAMSNRIPNPVYNVTYTRNSLDLDFGTSDDLSIEKLIKALSSNPTIAAIIYRRAEMLSNGIINVSKNNDNKAKENAPIVIDALVNPNTSQAITSFLIEAGIYIQLFGFCPVMRVRSIGFNGYKQGFILKPERCRIKWKRNVFAFNAMTINELIDTFEYTENGATKKFTREEIDDLYFFTDNTIRKADSFLPSSRVNSLFWQIENQENNQRSRKRSLVKPFGFLSNEGKQIGVEMPFDQTQRDELDNLMRKHSSSKDVSGFVATTANVKWTPVGFNVRENMLIELNDDDINTICNVLGFEKDMLANTANSTYANKEHAIKSQYTNFEIPRAQHLAQQLKACFEPNDKSIKVAITFDHLQPMQEDMKLSAEIYKSNVSSAITAFKNNACTYQSLMNRLKETTIIETWANKFWKDLTEEERAMFEKSNSQNSNTNEPSKN